MKQRLLSIFIVVICSGIFSTVFADDPNSGENESFFKAGAAALTVDKAQKGGDTDFYVLPLLVDTKHHLLVFGTNIHYVLFYEDGWMFSATGASRLEGYDNKESDRLNGMHDRDNTYELGATLSKEFSWGKLEGGFLGDILDKHRGQEIQLTYSKGIAEALNIKPLTLTPSAGLNWRSHQLNDYYYGVRAFETAAGRPAYHAGSSVDFLTGLRADYALTDRWNLFSSLNLEWLGSEIKDSPIVDQDYLLSFFIGAMYRF